MDLAADWEYIAQVMKARLAHNKTSRHVSDYGTYIEMIGAAGELAARRFLKLPETLHKNFDGGADLIWEGRRVDVKATIWTPKLKFRFLQWPITKAIQSEIIILTAVNMERKQAAVIGFATKDEILRAPINDKRDRACHEIPVRALHGPHELLPIAEDSALRGQPSYAYSP